MHNFYYLIMKEKINLNDEVYDLTEEYFNNKVKTYESESEEYFPQDTSTPPHY